MTMRTDRLSSVLQRAIQSVLSEGLNDPRLEAMLTITRVKVSPDLHEAVVSVSVIPESKEKLALHGLRDASPHIRRRASDRVRMQRLPKLLFKLDRSLKREAEVLATLREIGEASGETPEATDPSGSTDQAVNSGPPVEPGEREEDPRA